MFAPRCSHWLDLDPLIASRTLGHSWTIAASHQNQGKTLFPKKVANRLERQHVLCTCCTGTNNALPPPWKNPQQQSATGWCERLQSISMLQCSNPGKLQYSSGIITSKKFKTYQILYILLTYWECCIMLCIVDELQLAKWPSGQSIQHSFWVVGLRLGNDLYESHVPPSDHSNGSPDLQSLWEWDPQRPTVQWCATKCDQVLPGYYLPRNLHNLQNFYNSHNLPAVVLSIAVFAFRKGIFCNQLIEQTCNGITEAFQKWEALPNQSRQLSKAETVCVWTVFAVPLPRWHHSNLCSLPPALMEWHSCLPVVTKPTETWPVMKTMPT